ncbi:unnamed protein product [Pleuronectes platessa]|uniref:Uncharacterized protein n=1 Tax=Pleuronectes platessa TaxID=8262 RepID=A0A9N7TQ16_PLEPL|nr:unnamed protein product [Pleuronectes platessa]
MWGTEIEGFSKYPRRSADLLSLMALCGTANGATGLSLSTSLIKEVRTGSLCLSVYLGYRLSSHCAQLLMHHGLHLEIKTTEDRHMDMNFVNVFEVFLSRRVPASGLCRRKATVQFSQAAVVSVPPMRRSTVAICT